MPDAGYALEKATVNGSDVTASVVGGRYTVSNVSANLTVTATFVQTAAATDVITLSSVGKGTYCSSSDLDFTGISDVKAYIASGYNYSTGSILLTRVYQVPAGTGLMLVGKAGTYQVPHTASSYTYVNMLKGITTAQPVPTTSDGYTNYILMNGADGVLFYKSSGSGNLGANRAYLQIPTRDAGSREVVSFEFDDEATGISSQTEAEPSDERLYNLNGLRVKQPAKGIYIRNGKKIVIH